MINGNHTLAVKIDGSLWAWGPCAHGQLGNGSSSGQVLSPVEIEPGTAWTCVAAGDHFCLGLKQDISYAWGDNGYGQLGVGGTDDSDVPLHVELY
ncbi:MAG: hypothetical protein KKD44_20420 [Proteobacteria bacterium]|nr:hypothetical protein [Pseudomonadota bacterium]